MFLAPCAFGGLFVLLFVFTLRDRRLATADRPTWSLRELVGTFYVDPRKIPDFAWAFASRFLFVLAYAFLTTYQAYYLLDQIGTAETDVPEQIFLGTLAQSVVVVAASLIGGRLSDRTGRRKVFVLIAATVYGLAMFTVAVASNFSGFLIGVAISGLGFGNVRGRGPRAGRRRAAEQGQRQGSRGVQHRRCAPVLGGACCRARHPRGPRRHGGRYGLLYAVAGISAICAAGAILPVRRVR
jgi:MFS family permease